MGKQIGFGYKGGFKDKVRYCELAAIEIIGCTAGGSSFDYTRLFNGKRNSGNMAFIR